MKRTIIAATAAALLASATFSIAAPQMRGGDHPRPSPEQMAENAGAMSDARIAALKAGLRLSAEQEKNWPALESALRELSQERIGRHVERAEKRAAQAQGEQKGEDAGKQARAERPDTIQRLERRADAMLERGSALKKLATAAAPLYGSLDEAQKQRFDHLFRQVEGSRMAHSGAHRPGGHERGEGRGWQRGPHHPGAPGPHWHRPQPHGGPAEAVPGTVEKL